MLMLLVLFVGLSAVLLLWLPRWLSVQVMAVLLVGLVVVLGALMSFFVHFKAPPVAWIDPNIWQELRLRTTLSMMIIIATSLMGCVVFPLILKSVICFHQKFNPTFDFINRPKLHARLRLIMRVFFFVGSALALYGTWTAPKV